MELLIHQTGPKKGVLELLLYQTTKPPTRLLIYRTIKMQHPFKGAWPYRQ